MKEREKYSVICGRNQVLYRMNIWNPKGRKYRKILKNQIFPNPKQLEAQTSWSFKQNKNKEDYTKHIMIKLLKTCEKQKILK